MRLNFKNLPTDIQIDVITTLYSYNRCHIEHENGKMKVMTSYALLSKYAEDQWISQDFTREDFNIRFDANNAWYRAWTSFETKLNKRWADMEDEERDQCSADFDKMCKEKAKEDLERIIREAR